MNLICINIYDLMNNLHNLRRFFKNMQLTSAASFVNKNYFLYKKNLVESIFSMSDSSAWMS